MSYSFEEIMSYHSDNKNVYEEIKKNISVMVPFIGAGLTQFAYCSWKNALKELTQKITNNKERSQLKKLIQNGDYLAAAQRLEDLRTPANLSRDLVNLFSKEHLLEKQDILHKQVIYLLPMLFPGLILTTNFDETIEYVYHKYGLELEVSHPGHSELLEQLLRHSKSRGLFKFHGTISGDHIEYRNIVFTEQQYKRWYEEDSVLTKDLKKCIERKIILFLGCSLEKDLTMDLLQKTIQPGDFYYTIISCKKRERDSKIAELGKKQIRAILYEDNRHEAVRVILEHLLEETNPDTYKTLSYHEGALPDKDFSKRFSYDAGIVPFVGRKQEQKELKEFLNNGKDRFRWWAITGPGGAGKSRLAFEFQKQVVAEWKVCYLTTEDYDELSKLSDHLTQKTLLIADYVQEHAQKLGRWMETLKECDRSLPLRVLLVERESKNKISETAKERQLIDTSWEKQLYNQVRHEKDLRKACYKEDFLNLQPLSDQDLQDIIKNYADVLQSENNVLSDKDIEMLLKKLKDIDPDLCRPLYAMFLTDAFLAGKEPEKWSQEDVLDYVLEREQKRLDFCIAHVIDVVNGDKKLFAVCQFILCLATVLQDIKVDTLQEICPEQWKIIKDKAENFESPAALLERIGITVFDSKEEQILALRPDLIGEYYVYQWMIKQRKEVIEYFLQMVWLQPKSTVVFFDRMFNDYKHLLNTNPEYWEVMIPENFLVSEEAAIYFSRLFLIAITSCMSICQCQKMIGLLKNIVTNYSEKLEIAINFAESLFCLSFHQEQKEIQKIVEQLEQLLSKYPENLEIASYFAKVLYCLSLKQEETEKIKETVERLGQLTERYPKNLEIAVLFAESLYLLSTEQQERQKTIDQLENLANKYPENLEITISFAKGLSSLSYQQEETKRAVNKLEQLIRKYPRNLEIIVSFAKSLVNLSAIQQEGIQETIDKLEELASKHSKNLEIVIEFANGLVNLSAIQEEGIQETIKQLEKLVSKYPGNIEIIETFTRGLVNLSAIQQEGTQEIVERLEQLVNKYPKNLRIVVSLARSLTNLSVNHEEKRQMVVNRLEQLVSKYPENLEIAFCFAASLFNLRIKQEEKEMQKTIKRLENLSNKYPENLELTVFLAEGLVDLSVRQEKEERQETINRLKVLVEKYPDSLEIANIFAESQNQNPQTTDNLDTFGSSDVLDRIDELFEDSDSIVNHKKQRKSFFKRFWFFK